MKAEWVIGVFTGARAVSVKGHADAGIGYFIQKEEGRGMTYTVHAAFKRVKNGVRPDYLDAATPVQVAKLEQLQEAQNGFVGRNPNRTQENLHVRTNTDIFANRKDLN